MQKQVMTDVRCLVVRQTVSLLLALVLMPHSPGATTLIYSDTADDCRRGAKDDGDDGLGGAGVHGKCVVHDGDRKWKGHCEG